MNLARLTAAAAAILALVAVAGCRADPAVAAYLGDEQVTEAEVDAIMAEVRVTFEADQAEDLATVEALEEDEFAAALTQALEVDGDELQRLVADRSAGLAAYQQRQQEVLAESLAEARDTVIEQLILTRAIADFAAARGLDLPAPDPTTAAAAVGMPENHSYVGVVAGFRSAMGLLESQIQPVAPTEADQREVYDNLAAQGLDEGFSFEETQVFFTAEVIGQPVALRNLLREVVSEADLEVNPRYDDLVYRVPVPLGDDVESWLALPLGDSAVRDAGAGPV